MRLYLSSYHLGNQPELFAEIVGGNKKVALIMDAGDAFPEEERAPRLVQQQTNLAKIGLDGFDVDLRKYFGKGAELEKELSKYGGVWVLGGNTFVLRRAMHDSGFDTIIKEMLSRDQIAYGGYSAGVCVLAPSLKGIDLADVPTEVLRVFKQEILWDGLSVVPYMIVPHYKSDHKESEMMNDVVRFMEKEGLPYKTLRDGEAILIKGEHVELVG